MSKAIIPPGTAAVLDAAIQIATIDTNKSPHITKYAT